MADTKAIAEQVKNIQGEGGKEEGGEEITAAGETTSGLKKLPGVIMDGIKFIVKDIFAAGLWTLFGIIIGILRIVFWIIYYILVKIVPFLVIYFGIPLFILGALMAILFFGGHMFFLIAFFVGLYLYIRGLWRITFNLPKKSASDKSAHPNNYANNVTYKVKIIS